MGMKVKPSFFPLSLIFPCYKSISCNLRTEAKLEASRVFLMLQNISLAFFS